MQTWQKLFCNTIKINAKIGIAKIFYFLRKNNFALPHSDLLKNILKSNLQTNIFVKKWYKTYIL